MMRKRRAYGLDFVCKARVIQAGPAAADRFGFATRQSGEQTRRGSRVANTDFANADGGCAYGDYLDALLTDA